MNDIEKHGTQLARRLAAALEANIVTGPDWPNSQDELTRLQSARVLREMADQIDEFSTAPAVPLTDLQITRIYETSELAGTRFDSATDKAIAVARAIERAHGIGIAAAPEVK